MSFPSKIDAFVSERADEKRCRRKYDLKESSVRGGT